MPTLAAGAGIFRFTGWSAQLTYHPRHIDADAGSFSLSGQAASFKSSYKLAARAGYFTLKRLYAGFQYQSRECCDDETEQAMLAALESILSQLQPGDTPTVTAVNDSATSVEILAANTDRKSAIIYNDSSEILYIKYGGTSASTTDYTYKIAAGAGWIVDDYNGVIYGIWASDSTGKAMVTEII